MSMKNTLAIERVVVVVCFGLFLYLCIERDKAAKKGREAALIEERYQYEKRNFQTLINSDSIEIIQWAIKH